MDNKAHICHCLSSLLTLRRNSTVTVTASHTTTGLQFVEGVLSLAHGLLRLGLRPGHVVALSALNSDLYLEWMLAVAYVGGIAAPLNYRWSLEEAILAMKEVEPILLVADTSSNYWHSNFQTDLVPSLRWRVVMNMPVDTSSLGNVLTTESLKLPSIKSVSVSPVWAPEGAALICFTSGSTGRPKGVTISHIALIVQSLAKLAVVGYGEDDIYLHTAPLCHIGGISSAMAMLMVGGCHVFMPKFEAKLAIEAIEQYCVTSLITVPTMMADLIASSRKKNMVNGLETVKKVLNGGGTLTVQLIREAIKIFPEAKLISAYGMTEACSSITFKTLYDPKAKSRRQFEITCGERSTSVYQSGGVCVGKPAPHIELKISIEDSSRVGRILTRGPHVMLGYWGHIPTESPINGGWFDTGDIGEIDDYGNLWLIGRSKGRIKSGGENVYPEEVEGVLSQHPGISAVVVVGVPDSRLTEMVVACIQLKDNWQWFDLHSINSRRERKDYVSQDILQQFCREKNLSGFKIPRRIVLWKSPFPMTSTGKLRREQIRTEVTSQLPLLLSNL